jgi:hypothetical protein
MTLKLHKRHSRGNGATYINPETRARVQVSGKMFDGPAPEELEFNAGNIAAANEKDLARAKRLAEKAAKIVDLPAKLEKTRAKLAKLEAAMASQPSTGGTTSDQASA